MIAALPQQGEYLDAFWWEIKKCNKSVSVIKHNN